MKFFLICSCLLSLVLVVLIIRDWYVLIKLQRLATIKYDSLKALIQKLSSGVVIDEQEIAVIAQIPSLRLVLYRLLQTYERTGLFPKEFYTEEKGAESYLVDWLEFPTELGRPPDEIFFLKNVTALLPLGIHYYVFKFRSAAPRWASKIGWMLGVCGPYNGDSLPFDIPKKAFSRFNPADLMNPEAEVQWIHERMKR